MVPFGSHAERAVRVWREARASWPHPDSEPVFVNRSGERLSDRSVRRILDRYVRAAALAHGIHPHTLRHTFATDMLEGAPTCARSRSSSVIRRSPPPSATPTWTSTACAPPTARHRPRPARPGGEKD
ncbi:MAG: tyrosine-type recombinase/integrase [Thermoanaerobaculia bacterium]